jgi:hypothetical protein
MDNKFSASLDKSMMEHKLLMEQYSSAYDTKNDMTPKYGDDGDSNNNFSSDDDVLNLSIPLSNDKVGVKLDNIFKISDTPFSDIELIND